MAISVGEAVALYGPSGSGKSTLLRIAAAVLKPDSGDVLVDGQSIVSLSETDAAEYRMRKLGFVRQSLDLLPGASALDNAAFKLIGDQPRRAAHRQVGPILERLGLGDRLDQKAEHLSMGERQRVLIARAISTNPELLLADEPTGSLDTERGTEVLEHLLAYCRERPAALLLVTHDPKAASIATRTFTLRDGHLLDAPLPRAAPKPDTGAV
ncbi:MAG TPA: ATP-binding cassette domain-containing protein [Solirubrobacteraceae bacterium]|nr:ATP-binding cassette domain-containing protein [Solirubrobacteraceae bacterium]